MLLQYAWSKHFCFNVFIYLQLQDITTRVSLKWLLVCTVGSKSPTILLSFINVNIKLS